MLGYRHKKKLTNNILHLHSFLQFIMEKGWSTEKEILKNLSHSFIGIISKIHYMYWPKTYIKV
jgi:hypothetical protein